MNRAADRELLEGLERRGFRLSFGEDDTGWQIMYLKRGGGYYFDAGCSQMIIDGRVGLMQFDDIERFGTAGAMMKDGSVKPADLIVLATGYEGQAAAARRLLGDAVGDRIGRVWGFDEEGELQGMWRPTGQKGLWFHAGAGAVPYLFEGARVADQGAGAGHHRMIEVVRDAGLSPVPRTADRPLPWGGCCPCGRGDRRQA
ncbi:hypothetical protein ACFQU2_13670 [Siccirubricoccus deserti]